MGKNTQSLREFSAGGVVFKDSLWLVTKSAPSKLYPKPVWRLPKGWVDNEEESVPGPVASGARRGTEEELSEAALREVREEGGVEAKIVRKVTTISFSFVSTRGKVLKFVTYYLMEWVKDLPGGTDFETSEVAWLPFEEAYDRLTYQSEKDVLEKAKELV